MSSLTLSLLHGSSERFKRELGYGLFLKLSSQYTEQLGFVVA